MSALPKREIHGQTSFELATTTVRLAITETGGHLAPVTFFPNSRDPISPYAIAPWHQEAVKEDIPPVIRVLRGDFFCSAFGANAEAWRGRQLPLHGETANGRWELCAHADSAAGSWVRLGMDLPLQGGRCEATTAIVRGQTVIYQRHDMTGLAGPLNPGHHATLGFTDIQVARLSFSRLQYARTSLESLVEPDGHSGLQPDTEITSLKAVPCVDGLTTDLRCYPARPGCDDIVILCADPNLEFAWSAVTVPQKGYAWFALRDPKLLASTLLWFSNGGRRNSPWNGRHLSVLGVEDMTGFYHVGIAASSRENSLTACGIHTHLAPTHGRISIPYIQGVVRIPRDFDQVTSIQPEPLGCLTLRAASGASVETSCEIEFLKTGRLRALEA